MDIKHWNLNYLKSKIVYGLKSKKYKNAPWISYSAVDYLTKNVKPSMKIFEWGSGRSTIWFAHRCQFIISVEHNNEWYENISIKIKSLNIKNITYILSKNTSEYEEAIEKYKNEYFDLIVIDGIRRDCCIKKAFDKLRIGGSILLDDAQRYIPSTSKSPNSFKTWDENPNPEWLEVKSIIKDYEMKWFEDGISDSVVITKKA